MSDKEDAQRLTQYFAHNDIGNAAEQLISSCGTATYHLMKDVLAPWFPSDVTFDEIVVLMTTHLPLRSCKVLLQHQGLLATQNSGKSS